jgi:uncharacterized protein (DUF2141 family)
MTNYENGIGWDYRFHVSAPTSTAIIGMVLYNGSPLTDYTDKTPSFWAREEDNNTVPTLHPSYETDTGHFKLADMEIGKYGLQVTVDHDDNGYNRPNDFHGWTTPVYVKEGESTVEQDLSVSRILHLTSPFDNTTIHQSLGDERNVHEGEELKIEWDPLAEAADYQLSISLYGEDPYKWISTVVNHETASTSYVASLPATDEGQLYQLTLYANNADGVKVGQLMINYENGIGWDYRFKIGSTPSSTAIIGMVLYNGSPLSDYTDKTPSFWAREEDNNTVPTLYPSYNADTGHFKLADMEIGKYGLQVTLDDDGNGYNRPNDFAGWTTPVYVGEGEWH